jgi:CHAT domain-containing protein
MLKRTVIIGLVAAFCLAGNAPVRAEIAYNEPRQLTTHPGDDFAAVISPDGTFIIYVSDQSGNLDLWMKFIGPGVQPPARRLTQHIAEDNSPAISPDGKRVAFISHRFDPRGDILLLDLGGAEEGEAAPVLLTDDRLTEADPVWSRDGGSIYFVSEDPDTRKEGLFRIDVLSGARSPLIVEDAVNPAPSPGGGHLAYARGGAQGGLGVLDLETGTRTGLTTGPAVDMFPSWREDGRLIYFVRYQDDTNKDGQLDLDDNPNLWSVEWDEGRPGLLRQLTDSSTYDLLPAAGSGGLLFTSNRKNSIDIWQVPGPGLLPRMEGYGWALQAVEDLCPNPASYRCFLTYNNLLGEFKGRKSLARIRYQLARGYQEMGHRDTALAVYRELIEEDPEPVEYKGLAEIELLLLDIERSRDEGPTAHRRALEAGLDRLGELFERYRSRGRVESRALFETGTLHLELDEPDRALAFFRKVTEEYPRQRVISAEAAFDQSRIYSLVGDQQKVVAAYVQVIADYYDVDAWTDRAIQEILNLYEQAPTLEKKVSSLQALAAEQSGLPRLAAAVQNRIGELYHLNRENLLAKEAYRETLVRYPEVAARVFDAQVALANIYAEEENFEESLKLYEQLGEFSAQVEDLREAARQGWIEKSLEKGKWELRVGEIKLALKTFLKVMEESPATVEAHRGYLSAQAALGQAAQAVAFYKERVRENETSAVEAYALGLAYTYLDPPGLDAARREISRAILQDSRQVFFHQTLGWVFEQKDRKEPGGDFLERAVAEYEVALALNDETADPDNEADLLLNMGNGHYLLKNYYAAFLYYGRRAEAGVGFFNPAREAIFRQRFGESAFKVGEPEAALAEYEKALDLVSRQNDLARMAELNDRIALVHQELGQHARAVDHFSRTLDLNRRAGNMGSLSRSLRNIANNLFLLSEKGDDDSHALNRALRNYFAAIDNLEKYGVVEKKKKKRSGLIGIDVEAGAGPDASGAATGFDKAGEEKLIFHYIGRIYASFGEYGRAVDYFKKKLERIPDNLDPKKHVPVLLEKALLLNQIGYYMHLGGQGEESVEWFRASYDISRQLANGRGIAVNAANIGRVVFEQARTLPAPRFLPRLADAARLLEEAAADVRAMENFASPEYLVLIQNYLGVFHHALAYHGSGVARAEDEAPASAKAALRAALDGLGRQSQSALKSAAALEEGLKLLDSRSVAGQPHLRQALGQNIALSRSLLGGGPKGAPDPAPVAPAWLWRTLYQAALTASEGERLDRLREAERELDRLPAVFLVRDAPGVKLMEDLYRELTASLFAAGSIEEALRFSEKGRQQALLARQPRLKFEDADRQAYQDEIDSLGGRLRTLAEAAEEAEAFEAALAEYQEFLAMVREDDPRLAVLLTPDAPDPKDIAPLLAPGAGLLKVQRVDDALLLWLIGGGGVKGERVGLPAGLSGRLSAGPLTAPTGAEAALLASILAPVQAELERAKTLYLIADGALEFLPWAAAPLGPATLAEKMPLVFLESVTHLKWATAARNLYSSRYLGVESPPLPALSGKFASAETLAGDAATGEAFRERWAHFGVVHIDTPARLSPDDAAINLTGMENRFERLGLSDLLTQPVEAHLFALGDVDVRFDPETRLSPTAPLIRALTFKGYPGVLLRAGPKDEALHAELLNLFFERLPEGRPARALQLAQVELARRHPGNLAWAGYRFYGFPGMEEEEKNLFARTHFDANVEAGAKAFLAKDWLAAIDHLEKALALVRFLPDSAQAIKLRQTLAQAAYNREDYRKAIHYQEALLPAVEQADDPEVLAEALYFLGILESRAENFPKSVEHLKRALSIYEQYEILDRLAESYSTLGIVEENALDYDQALEAFRRSLEINQEIGEELNRGRELRRIGRIYYLRLSRYADARKYFTDAYDLFAGLDEKEQMAESLLELGLVSEKQGDFERALDYYQRAEELAAGEEMRAVLSKALLYQANSHWYQGAYQQAFRFQKSALDIAEALGDKRQEAFIYNTLGLIHWTLNHSKRALENLEKSLELAREIASPLDIATAYNNIGLVHRKNEAYETSIDFFSKALEKDIELKSKWGQGYTHRNLGMSLLRLGRLDEAETHIEQAVVLSDAIGNHINLVKSLLERGHLALERKSFEKAIEVFRETAKREETVNLPEVRWRALRGEGAALVAGGRRREAVAVYKEAVAVVDRLRAAIKIEEFQNGFLTDKQDVYKELVLLLLDMGRVEEAFNYAEKAKSRSFIDLLGNQRFSLKNDVSQRLYDQLMASKQSIRLIEDALAEARSKEDEAGATRLAGELEAARNGYQDLLIAAKEESPQISSFVTVDAIELDALQGLLEEGTALVEYLVTRQELVAWVVTKGGIEVVRTAVAEADLNARIADYRKRIQQLAPVEEVSERLHGWLIAPLAGRIAEARVLGIVPHGHLHYLSFASLKDKEAYLIERHPLFYSPSASVLRYTFGRKREISGPVRVLALGNPDLGDFNYDLPLAEMEANAIRWDFPTVDVLTREKATETWLKEHIGDYQIIHIASHGEFDPVNPLFSSLKLTKDEAADGNFEVNEVFSLKIDADIVTLSACQTGLGDIKGGDELVGLNRAFIYAGTHSILSSLWRVSDISTAVLIKHFYRNFAHGEKAESLRKAQLLVKKFYPHPSYWAGFSLSGDHR